MRMLPVLYRTNAQSRVLEINAREFLTEFTADFLSISAKRSKM